jgi:hypothetical protein
MLHDGVERIAQSADLGRRLLAPPRLKRRTGDLILRACKLEGGLKVGVLVGSGRTDRPLHKQRRDVNNSAQPT